MNPRSKRLTTAETAQLLGLTERRVRQLGPMLGGTKDADGRLTFDRGAVLEHAEMRGRQRIAALTTQQVGALSEQVGIQAKQIAGLTLHVQNLWHAIVELQQVALENHPNEESVEPFDLSQPRDEWMSSSSDDE